MIHSWRKIDPVAVHSHFVADGENNVKEVFVEPKARSGTRCVYLKQKRKILLHGGFDGKICLNDLFFFDIDTEKWTEITSPTTGFIGDERAKKEEEEDSCYSEGPCGREGHTFILHELSQTIWVFGGYCNFKRSFLNDFYKMDLQNFVWKRVRNIEGAEIPPRYYHASVVYEDFLYIAFGRRNNSYFDDVYQVDLKRYNCKQVECFGLIKPFGRYFSGAVQWKGKMFIFGGYSDSKGKFDDLFSLNLNTFEWQQHGTLSSSANPINDHIHENNGQQVNVVNFGNHGGENRYSSSEQRPSPRCGHECFCDGDCLYVFGGLLNAAACNDLYKFDFGNERWSPFLVATSNSSSIHHNSGNNGVINVTRNHSESHNLQFPYQLHPTTTSVYDGRNGIRNQENLQMTLSLSSSNNNNNNNNNNITTVEGNQTFNDISMKVVMPKERFNTAGVVTEKGIFITCGYDLSSRSCLNDIYFLNLQPVPSSNFKKMIESNIFIDVFIVTHG